MRIILIASLLVMGAACAEQLTPPSATGPLAFTLTDINGKNTDLSMYRGKVVLMVNVASHCGFTPQYRQLQALYEKYRKQGLVILGFPANNFGQQEPGTDAEIANFCSTTYNVTFDMFDKISVKGDDIAPLYRYLTSKETNPHFGGEIAWNFTKFLIDRDGRVVNRFEPKTTPDDPIMVKAIEAEIAKPRGLLSFTMSDITGKDVDLSVYRGKVVLIVNVASHCGFTPQYRQLQALYTRFAQQGFVIIGFPANNFGVQEPGTNSEIAAFCSTSYDVTFDLFSKISVKGKDIAPLYQFLTSKVSNPHFGGEIAWNFTKFLIDRDGRVINRFEPKVTPDDPSLVKAIEEGIAKSAH